MTHDAKSVKTHYQQMVSGYVECISNKTKVEYIK